jgi:hypothetical protein
MRDEPGEILNMGSPEGLLAQILLGTSLRIL